MQKVVKTRSSLRNTIKYILAQSCVTPLSEYIILCREGLRMIVFTSCFHYFLYGASLHRAIHSFLHLLHIFFALRSYTHVAR